MTSLWLIAILFVVVYIMPVVFDAYYRHLLRKKKRLEQEILGWIKKP